MKNKWLKFIPSVPVFSPSLFFLRPCFLLLSKALHISWERHGVIMNKKSTSIILVASFLLAACSSEDTVSATPTPTPTPTIPTISSVTGTILTGSSVTISGAAFSEKENPAPLFWWNAEDGKTPSSLGRLTWAPTSTVNGEISTVQVSPGATQSVRWDHGASAGAALGEVYFGTAADRIYLHRKLYEDFDVTKAVAIRTRVTTTPALNCPSRGTAGALTSGDVVTGSTSGATGIVEEFYNEEGKCAIFYKNVGGTINDDPPVNFEFGETMTSPGVTDMVNSEGSTEFPTGVLTTFNYKTLRFWHLTQKNNTYPVIQGKFNATYSINRENSDATLVNNDFDNPLSQIPFQWNTEEIVYKASSAPDVSDARFDFHQNGVLASDDTFISRTATRPEPYEAVFQSQVSNGAQVGSFAYYKFVIYR